MSSQPENDGMDIDDQQQPTSNQEQQAALFAASTSSPLAFPTSSNANPSSDIDQLPIPRSVQQLRGNTGSNGQFKIY